MTERHIHDLPGLSDIQPLLDNEGLGDGDVVYSMNSGVTCASVGELRARGVRAGTDCWFRAALEWWWALLAGGAALVAGALALWTRRRAVAARHVPARR